MKKLITISGLLLFIILFFVLKPRISADTEKTLNLVINNEVRSFDPAVAFNDDALFVMSQSYETLYQYHYLKRPFEVIPSLADGMPEISKDGLVYIIKVKKDIYYHEADGVLKSDRTLKVDDFIWQIKRLAYKPLKSTGKWLFEGKLKGFSEFSEIVGDDFQKFLITDISGLIKVDDHTFKIILDRPEPNLLYFLSMQFTIPVPLEVIDHTKNDLSKTLVGTGPYEFINHSNLKYYFKKFDNFHEEFYPSSGDRYANTENLLGSSKKKLPFVSNVIFEVISDESLRWEKFLSKNIDILDVPTKYLVKLSNPTSEANQNFKKKEINVKHFSRQTTRWLGFNMNDPILGENLNLRLAIAHAINYDRYIEVITNNTNLRSNSMFNPSIQGYRPTHQLPYDYNLTKAKSFLSKSGIKPGELTLTYSTRGKQQIHFDEAEFLQSQLKRIGIALKINVIEFSDFLRLGRAGELQFWTDNWIYDYPDAENLLQLLISKNHPGINKSGYSNDKVDQLYDKLSKTLQKEDRQKIMYEIEKIVETELPWIMLMYESTYILQQKNIRNFRKSFFIRNFIKYLDKD